jgi:hypothetical protein
MSAYNEEQLKALARQNIRQTLAFSSSFQAMPKEEQLSFYKDLVLSEYNRLSKEHGVSKQMMNMPKKASDMIDDERHRNKNIKEAGDIAQNFMEGVDFPNFVKDLLQGVFDANLNVTIQQMKAYQDLMKAATASISKFVNAIDDSESFGYLAENSGDDFSFGNDDESGKQVLMDREGNVLAVAGEGIDDNTLKAKIMDAKIAMAKEHRALLRETILMGVTRLVVEKGTVKAGVVFDIKAKEKIENQDKAAVKDAKSTSGSISIQPPFGGFLGGASGGGTHSRTQSKISISSAKSQNETELNAKVTGSVEIIFKSDYFKLDNFAAMYGNIGQETPATNGTPPATTTPPTPPTR